MRSFLSDATGKAGTNPLASQSTGLVTWSLWNIHTRLSPLCGCAADLGGRAGVGFAVGWLGSIRQIGGVRWASMQGGSRAPCAEVPIWALRVRSPSRALESLC